MRCSAQVDKFTTKSVPHIRIDRLPEILLRVAPYMPITRPAPHMIICVQLQLHRNTAGQSRFLQRQGSEQESSPPRLEASRCRQPEEQLNFRFVIGYVTIQMLGRTVTTFHLQTLSRPETQRLLVNPPRLSTVAKISSLSPWRTACTKPGRISGTEGQQTDESCSKLSIW